MGFLRSIRPGSRTALPAAKKVAKVERIEAIDTLETDMHGILGKMGVVVERLDDEKNYSELVSTMHKERELETTEEIVRLHEERQRALLAAEEDELMSEEYLSSSEEEMSESDYDSENADDELSVDSDSSSESEVEMVSSPVTPIRNDSPEEETGFVETLDADDVFDTDMAFREEKQVLLGSDDTLENPDFVEPRTDRGAAVYGPMNREFFELVEGFEVREQTEEAIGAGKWKKRLGSYRRSFRRRDSANSIENARRGEDSDGLTDGSAPGQSSSDVRNSVASSGSIPQRASSTNENRNSERNLLNRPSLRKISSKNFGARMSSSKLETGAVTGQKTTSAASGNGATVVSTIQPEHFGGKSADSVRASKRESKRELSRLGSESRSKSVPYPRGDGEHDAPLNRGLSRRLNIFQRKSK